MSEELKPCPHCGSLDIGIGYNGQPAKSFYACCIRCGAIGPIAYPINASGGMDGTDISNALNKWNDRHAPEGMALVPVEPTDEMKKAGAEYMNSDGVFITKNALDFYKTMIKVSQEG